jgi:hypothetical protein
MRGEPLRARRREHWLAILEASRLLGIDPRTFGKLERDQQHL